jgi:hypothetical protein
MIITPHPNVPMQHPHNVQMTYIWSKFLHKEGGQAHNGFIFGGTAIIWKNLVQDIIRGGGN